MIEYLHSFLSNREIALLFWIGVFCLVMLFNSAVRIASFAFIRALFQRQLIMVLLLHTFYISIILFLLIQFHLWSFDYLKDTVAWYLAVAIVCVVNINKVSDISFFVRSVLDLFKWMVIVEFAMNIYTFSLPIEIVLMPILFLLSGMIIVARHDNSKAKVIPVIQFLLGFIGLLLLIFFVFKFISQPESLFTWKNLYQLVLPIELSILLIPFLYFLALYVHYEELFTRIERWTYRDELKIIWKKEIWKAAQFNLNKLISIRNKINKHDVYHSDSGSSYF